MMTACGSGRSSGYCGRDGLCVVSGCNSFNGVVPCNLQRFDLNNPCLQQCNALNQTNIDQKCFEIPFATPLIYAQQGAECKFANGSVGVCTIDGFNDEADLFKRPIPNENFIEVLNKPYCKLTKSYQIQITDKNKFNVCGCDGYSTVQLACLENNINYVSLEKCLFESNQWYPDGQYVKCTPPPYCRL